MFFFTFILFITAQVCGIISIFSPKSVFTVIVIDLNFPKTTISFVGCSICLIAAGFSNIKPQVRSDRDLDLSRRRDVIGHVIIQFASFDFL